MRRAEDLDFPGLRPLELSVIECTNVLGVNKNTLNNPANEKFGISPDMTVRLSKAFGGPRRTWLGMQMEYNLAQAEDRANNFVVERVASKAQNEQRT